MASWSALLNWRFARASVLAWLAVVFLIPGYGAVVVGLSWIPRVLAVVTIVALACLIVRALRWKWAEAIELVVGAYAICLVFAAPTLRWGIVPGRATLEALGSDLAAAGRLLASEAAPVAAVPGISLALAGLCALAIIGMDVFVHRWRSPGAVGLVLAVLFVLPTAVAEVEPRQLVFIPAAACWLLMLRGERRVSASRPWVSWVPVTLIAGAALVFAATTPISPASLRDLNHDWGAGTPDPFAAGVDPNIELGRNLRRNVPRTTMTYTTTLSEPPYLKIATLREFTGDTWRPVERDSSEPSPSDRAVADRHIAATTERTSISIKKLRSHRLPVPYPATNITGLEGSWRWQRAGLTLHSDKSTTAGQQYRVNSSEVKPTLAQLRNGDLKRGGIVWDQLRAETRLPSDTPSVIGRTAERVTAGAGSNYDRAVALQDWLRSSGEFAYSEVAPVAEGYDGTGVDVISQFLDEKRGYCVHFASTMAVMARELGIPARLAVGFAPGNVVRTNDRGAAVYEVTTDNMHAWPELYFGGVGWVRFDPTPTVGSPTRVTREVEPGEIDDESGTAPDAPEATTGAERAGEANAVPDGQNPASGVHWRWPLLALAVIVLVAPATISVLRRRLRLRTGQPEALWQELINTARDAGHRASSGLTPRQFAASLGGLPEPEQRTLDELVAAVEAERYGPDGFPHRLDRHAAATMLESVRRTASRPVRWRGRLLPPSVFVSS